MSLGEHVCEETLKQSHCQRDFLAYDAFRQPTGNDSGLYTSAAYIVNHVGGSRPNVVPRMLAQPIRSWGDPRPTFVSFPLLNFAKLGACFGAANLDPRFDIPIKKKIGTEFRDPFLDPKNI